ncbi:WhiB family transcriptional regulator (plasmid) [Rhodococcus sp. ZPP]|uniref:WhiB family transcriptional regulator n=1 Tax=unclassified Rhodococcus (in: high G+C Gram-positive bacteria) TaxID=192944 RepID=UPI001AD863CB|nr:MULTISPECIES: WhiB family transcriptional regulator [unclassified Rhodococcus (in: high G+C Gram-positive bacteria)]QTJ70379.1 WhiB family transcriptional regulator [Rhodococcus sp. ZPP]
MPDHSHHRINPDWQHHASCRGADTEIFFSPDGERRSIRSQRERAAKQICQACPVLADCRAHALTAAETYGIWGGMSENERAHHTRRTRRTARHRPNTPAATNTADPKERHRDHSSAVHRYGACPAPRPELVNVPPSTSGQRSSVPIR